MDYSLLILIGIGAIGAAEYIRRRKPKAEPKVEKVQPTPEVEPRVKILQPGNYKKKREAYHDISLQPAKVKPIPQGYTVVPTAQSAEDSIELMENHFVENREPMPKREYCFKFYGSQLVVGKKTVFTGLGKHLHRLEITAQDQCFIDGKPAHLHPNDMEDVKAAILKAQEEV